MRWKAEGREFTTRSTRNRNLQNNVVPERKRVEIVIEFEFDDFGELTHPILASDLGLQKTRRQSKIEYFSMKSFLSSKYMYVVYGKNKEFYQNSIFRSRKC